MSFEIKKSFLKVVGVGVAALAAVDHLTEPLFDFFSSILTLEQGCFRVQISVLGATAEDKTKIELV